MQAILNLIDVSKEPEDYGRYPVLVVTATGNYEVITAHYHHPPGAMNAGWFDSEEDNASPIDIEAWAQNVEIK